MKQNNLVETYCDEFGFCLSKLAKESNVIVREWKIESTTISLFEDCSHFYNTEDAYSINNSNNIGFRGSHSKAIEIVLDFIFYCSKRNDSITYFDYVRDCKEYFEKMGWKRNKGENIFTTSPIAITAEEQQNHYELLAETIGITLPEVEEHETFTELYLPIKDELEKEYLENKSNKFNKLEKASELIREHIDSNLEIMVNTKELEDTIIRYQIEIDRVNKEYNKFKIKYDVVRNQLIRIKTMLGMVEEGSE